MLNHNGVHEADVFSDGDRTSNSNSEHALFAHSDLLRDLLNDFPKHIPSQERTLEKGQDSVELASFIVLRSQTKVEREDFKKELGDRAAAFLDQIGCKQIERTGSHFKMTLDKAHTIDIDRNGIKDVKLEKEIDFDVEKTSDKIRINGLKGVRLNPKFFFELDMPDFTITQNGIDLGRLFPEISMPGLYDQMNDLVTKLYKEKEIPPINHRFLFF